MATPSSSTKKSTTSKARTAKSSAKRPSAKTAKSSATPKQSAEEKAADDILKLVDQAANLLRSGVRSGAKNAAQNRTAASKKAHSLLTKATSHLTQSIEGTSSILQKGIKKIGG